MQASPVDQRWHRVRPDHINTRAKERKVLRGEIDNSGRLRNTAVKPRLYGVALRGTHIGRFGGQEGPHVAVNSFLHEYVRLRCAKRKPRRATGEPDSEQDRCCKCTPCRPGPAPIESNSGIDPRQQMSGHSFARELRPHGILKRGETCELGSQRRIRIDCLLYRERGWGIQLAIKIGVNQQRRVCAGGAVFAEVVMSDPP